MKEYRLVEELIKKNWHITFAESCTGGMAAATLVNVPDASKIFDGSFVTYANHVKVDFLDVSQDMIRKYGVVSEEIALAMAKGAALKMNADVAVGISGVAGPGGATSKSPVGKVCFGFIIGKDTYSSTMEFGPLGRQEVRNSSVAYVFDFLLEKLS